MTDIFSVHCSLLGTIATRSAKESPLFPQASRLENDETPFSRSEYCRASGSARSMLIEETSTGKGA